MYNVDVIKMVGIKTRVNHFDARTRQRKSKYAVGYFLGTLVWPHSPSRMGVLQYTHACHLGQLMSAVGQSSFTITHHIAVKYVSLRHFSHKTGYKLTILAYVRHKSR